MAQLPTEENLAAFSVGQVIALGATSTTNTSPWVLLPGPGMGMLAVLPGARFRALKRAAVQAGMNNQTYSWPTVRTMNQSVQLAGQPYALYAEKAEEGVVDSAVLNLLDTTSSLCENLQTQNHRENVYREKIDGYVYEETIEARKPDSFYPPETHHFRVWNLWDGNNAGSLYLNDVFPEASWHETSTAESVLKDPAAFLQTPPRRVNARVVGGDFLAIEEPMQVSFTLDTTKTTPWLRAVSIELLVPTTKYRGTVAYVQVPLSYASSLACDNEFERIGISFRVYSNLLGSKKTLSLESVQKEYESEYQGVFPH